MPIRKENEQRIVFTISKNSAGRMMINMAMTPKMAKSEEEFEKLPMYKREMQSAAARIGKLVMRGLAEEEKERRNSLLEG